MSCERKSRWISAPRLAALIAACSLWLALAAPAGAQPPVVESSGVHPTSLESELVFGEVNPGGSNTQYLVQYGPASSDWCGTEPSLLASIAVAAAAGAPSVSAFDHLADGFWPEPPYFTKPMKLGFHDHEAHSVSVELDELMSGGEYCAQLIAFNDSGFGAGGELRFTAGAPTVESVTPSSGPAGGASTVTIMGENLDAASAVRFGTAAASIEFQNQQIQLTTQFAADFRIDSGVE